MSPRDKVWVIDGGSGRRPGPPPAGRAPASKQERSPVTDPAPPGPYDHGRGERSLTAVVLAYLTGPFSLVVTREGRRNKAWLAVALASGLGLGFMLWRWMTFHGQPRHGGLAIALWMLFAGTVILLTFTAWARGILLAARQAGSVAQYLPVWMTTPWAVGVAGLIVPGLGLLIAGYSKRAARTLWLLGPLSLSVALLVQSGRIWAWNRDSGPAGIPGQTLELILLLAAGIALIGTLGWIIQALDGMRLASSRREVRRQPAGDWPAVALLAAVLAFVALFNPPTVAEKLDECATVTRAEGMQVVPLYTWLSASRLDPSHPVYVMRATEIYDELGQDEVARRMRSELDRRWRTYEDAMRGRAPLVGYVEFQSSEEFPTAGQTDVVGSAPTEPHEGATVNPIVETPARETEDDASLPKELRKVLEGDPGMQRVTNSEGNDRSSPAGR